MMNRRARIKGKANIPVRNKSETATSSQKNETEAPENNKPQEPAPNVTDTEKENAATADEIKTEVFASDDTSNVNTNNQTTRRWVHKPKPLVKIPSGLRRPKPVIVPVKEEPNVSQNIENECRKNTDNEIKSPLPNTSDNQEIKTPTTPNESVLKSPEPDRILASPLSPNKILNRARIRPTPKLIRRNSVQGSASESEDDGRRSRIRNDSVCSTSTEILTVKENTIISKDKLISIKVQKLFRRSEQSRKVADARRDFYQKFGTNIPDRKRLTMMDLIYYNPTTNPMPPKKQQTEITIVEPETVEEEVVDDPEEIEEDSNPVPQVKVGPNGEIILDEQSLVIEQTGMKKGREKLANSQVVNVDDLDRTYGVYKRPKRSKDWSAMETLRFYRSLNTVGTDFSLMVSLFPGRTRRELKIKFKKEEKINRQLIDKALTNPVDFDLSELEKQFKEEEELMKKLEEEEQEKKKTRKTTKPKGRPSFIASEMDEEYEDSSVWTEKVRKVKVKPPKDDYSALIVSEITTSEYESDEEIIPRKKKRIFSGRDSLKENSKSFTNLLLNQANISINISDDEKETNNETIAETNEPTPENNQNCAIPNILPNDLSTVEPGSLMILSSTGPDGQQIFKVFMVTPGQSKVPVNLSEDVVESLTTSLGSAEAVTLDLPVINETDNQILSSDT